MVASKWIKILVALVICVIIYIVFIRKKENLETPTIEVSTYPDSNLYCDEGTFLFGNNCMKKCSNNFRQTVFFCSEPCSENYQDMGLTCISNEKMYFKNTYIPESEFIKNLDASNVSSCTEGTTQNGKLCIHSCPPNYDLKGALCIEKCSSDEVNVDDVMCLKGQVLRNKNINIVSISSIPLKSFNA